MTNEKLPPHDIDAEEAVIGSLLIDGEAIYHVAAILDEETDYFKLSHFYHEPTKLLYKACLSLYQPPRNEAINQITVAQELDRQGKLEACGGAAYLSHLVSIVPTSLDVEHYAQIVRRLAISRRLIDAARQIEAIGYKADPDTDHSLGDAEDILYRLRHGQSPRDFVHIRQVLDKYFEMAPPGATPAEGYEGRLPYALSGFTGLDELLGGFQHSDLVIIGGRPSMGKTSLVLNIARNVAVEQGGCVAMFSLEMARDSLVWRLLSGESGVNLSRIRLGLHTEEEEKRIMEATGKLSEASIYVDDTPQLRVVEMRGRARRLHFERPIDLIILDYLHLMEGDGRAREGRVQEVSYISRSLKALARELDVPVLAVSQLSRAPESRALHAPMLSDLRESGSIEQDADVVIFVDRDELHYPTREAWELVHPGEQYPPPTNIIVAKHRNGPIGQINLRFISILAKFENIASEEPSLL